MASEKDLIQSDIEGYLARYQDKELLRFVAVGSVDDGKSTLIGRLLFDTGSVYQDQLEAVRKATHMAGTEIDLSLLTDGLAAEREQGITIDVAYRYFTTDKRKFIIADTPGHVQYTRNMVTGASTASVAIILIDARLGVLQQSRRHAYIASLLGIPHLAVCVNKMDLIGFDRATFERIRAEFTAFTKSLAFTGVTFFPISALTGANCVHKSDKTPWYEGATVLEFLESVPVADKRDFEHLRYPVQYVTRPNLDYRGFAGRVASGVVRKGDAVTVLPSRQSSRVKAIDTIDKELGLAFAPQSITIRLDDEIDVSRGCMLVHSGDLPAVTRTFDAHLVWMQSEPLDLGRTYLLKHTTQTVRADVDRVHGRRDMDTLEEVAADTLTLNEIGRVTITAHRELFLDPYDANRETGSFILIDTISNGTVAAGMVMSIDRAAPPDAAGTAPGASAPRSEVTDAERRARFGASAAIVLVASDTPSRALATAYATERALFDLGITSVVVDRRVGAGALTAAEALKNAGILAIVPATRGHKQAAHDIVVDVDASVGRDAGQDARHGADEVIAALRDGNWIAPSRTRS
jgi:bifunctional enzyme CysN/CysC